MGAIVTADGISSVQLAPASTGRTALTIFNRSPSVLVIAHNATASLATAVAQIPGGGTWVMPKPVMTGPINGIWLQDSNGAAEVSDVGGNNQAVGICAIGDSITDAYGDNDTRRQQEGYLSNACMTTGQAVSQRIVLGGAGFTLASIQSTHLPVVLALNPRPLACVVHGGTNDVGLNNGAGYTVTANITTLQQIADTLLSFGIQPILSTIIPRADNATVNQNVGKLNRAIWKLASENGYYLVDLHRSVCNVSTGGFIAGYAQTDGIHPGFRGVKKMGNALAVALPKMRLAYIDPPRPTHKLDPSNLLGADGHFTVDTNADGISDGFASFSGTGMTFSRVTDPDGITIWQKISMPNTGTGNALLQKVVNSVVTAGDIIEVVCRVQTTGFETALVDPVGLNGGVGPAWGVTVTVSGGTHDVEAAYSIHTDQADGLVYARGLITAGASGQLKFNIFINSQPAAGTVTAQFSEFCVRNLTTLGLV